MPRYNPFDLDRPAAVAFSGGRTSGLMLYRILEAFDGTLPEDVHVVFCNTGKERPETLDFVEECSLRWGVNVVWLEYRHEPGRHYFEQVDYATASRCGEPFEHAIRARSYLPNRVSRFCTAELKVKTMWRWAKSIGLTEYTKAIGLRHDEPKRVRRILSGNGEGRASEEIVLPLDEARVTFDDVTAFWAAQPFDLKLKPHEGNCDLCFLKRRGSLVEMMRERPDLATWWIEQEATGKLFRTPNDRPRYELLLAEASQPRLYDDEEDEIDCACTD